MPYVFSQLIWLKQDESETKELASEFERCRVVVGEATIADFSGTIDIQGKVHEQNDWSNVPYIRQDQATIQTPSVDQLVFADDSGIYRYTILGYWRRLRIVMTRTAGTITVGIGGSSDAQAFPYLPTQLIANDGVDIGNVDVVGMGAVQDTPAQYTLLRRLRDLLTGIVLAAGTAILGWVMYKRIPVHTHTTGTGAALASLTPAATFHLLGIRVHISTGAPLAAAETLTVTLDSGDGAAYDVVLFELDMGTPDIRDVVIPFGGDEDFFESGDVIVVALSANAGGDTFGCETIHELV